MRFRGGGISHGSAALIQTDLPDYCTPEEDEGDLEILLAQEGDMESNEEDVDAESDQDEAESESDGDADIDEDGADYDLDAEDGEPASAIVAALGFDEL